MTVSRNEFDELYDLVKADKINKEEFFIWVTDLLDEANENGMSDNEMVYID